MRPIGQCNRGGCTRNFFADDCMGKIRQIHPAVLFLDGYAQQTEVTHFLPQLGWKHIGLVDLCCNWLDPILSPAVSHVAQRIDVFAQVKSHCRCEHDGLSIYEQMFNSYAWDHQASSIHRRAQITFTKRFRVGRLHKHRLGHEFYPIYEIMRPRVGPKTINPVYPGYSPKKIAQNAACFRLTTPPKFRSTDPHKLPPAPKLWKNRHRTFDYLGYPREYPARKDIQGRIT